MPSSILRFSDEQFNKVVKAIGKGDQPKFNLDMLFKLIQLLAILAAGIWTIYTYVTFQRGQQLLSLQQQEISKEQQKLTLEQDQLLADTRRRAEEASLDQQEFNLANNKLLAGTQKSTAEVSLRQQEFSLAQNRLLAGTQRDLAKTSLAQQQFALDQQRLISDSEVRKADSAAKQAEIDNQIKEMQANAAAQSPFKYVVQGELHQIAMNDTGIGEYKLDISVEAHNLSEREIHVTSAVVELYLGESKPTDNIEYVLRMNMPDEHDGPVNWRLAMPIISYISIDANHMSNYCINRRKQGQFIVGGPAFGRLRRLEQYYWPLEFRVKAQKSKWLGWRVILYTGNECSQEQQYLSRSYFALAEVQ